MSDERPRLVRVELPSDRDLLLRMLDETTGFLGLAEPLRDAFLSSKRMLRDPAVQADSALAHGDLEPILNGRSHWAALGDIEGRYPTVDALAGVARRTIRLTEDLATHCLPLTGGRIEVSGFPDAHQSWCADLRADGEMFGSFVEVVRETRDAILSKLTPAPAEVPSAPPTTPGIEAPVAVEAVQPSRGRMEPGARAVAAAYQLSREAKPVSLRAACELAKVDRANLRKNYPEAVATIEALSGPDRAPRRGVRDRRTGDVDAWDSDDDD